MKKNDFCHEQRQMTLFVTFFQELFVTIAVCSFSCFQKGHRYRLRLYLLGIRHLGVSARVAESRKCAHGYLLVHLQVIPILYDLETSTGALHHDYAILTVH